MYLEHFGFNEKPFTDEHWEEIAHTLRNSSYVKGKYKRMVTEADHHSRRFENIAILSGGFFFLALLNFPVIRMQPGLRRVGLCGAVSYGVYWFVHGIAENMRMKRIQFAYRNVMVDNKEHHRITL